MSREEAAREKRCQGCGLVLHPANSDESAIQEFNERFGADGEAIKSMEEEGVVVLCDACYGLILARMREIGYPCERPEPESRLP